MVKARIYKVVQSMIQDKSAKPVQVATDAELWELGLLQEPYKRHPGTFYVGDIFQVEKDFSRLSNLEELTGHQIIEPIGSDNDGFDKMTVKQLQDIAEAEEIELGNAMKKHEIIEILRSALVS